MKLHSPSNGLKILIKERVPKISHFKLTSVKGLIQGKGSERSIGLLPSTAITKGGVS